MQYQKIKELRMQKKWSLRRLAAESGVSFMYIRELEEGKKTKPSVDVILKLAQALGVTLNDLLNINNASSNAS